MNVRKIIKTFNKNVRKYVQKFEFFNIQDKTTNKLDYDYIIVLLVYSNHIFIDIIIQMRFE